MRVLFINESDFDGGAARAMSRLGEALSGAGIELYTLVKYRTLSSAKIIQYKRGKIERLFTKYNNIYINKFRNGIKPERKQFYLRNPFSQISGYIKEIAPDLIHIHRVTWDFFELNALKKLKIPIVITFHDMNGFTGGCSYPGECTRYSGNCGRCPTLNSNRENDISRRNFIGKGDAYSKMRSVDIITPSSWMKNEALKSSAVKRIPLHFIPNCIDLKKYKPAGKYFARSVLNLPQEKRLILFGAAGGITDERKGFRYFVETINKLPKEEFEVILFGPLEKPVEGIDAKVHNFVRIKDELSLVLLYSAADVMLVPSVQENLANTIMESMACGTPVAAFSIGGNKEMISHLHNGFLATPFSPDELAAGVNYILENGDRCNIMGKSARDSISAQFNYSLIAGKHIKLYEEILNGFGKRNC